MSEQTETADVTAAPEAPEAAPAAEEAPAEAPPAPEPPKPDLATKVLERRDPSQLAAIVKANRELQSSNEKLKVAESKAASFAKIERLLEDGDDDEAAMELLRLKHGDKAGERLSHLYNGLTRRVLGEKVDPRQVKDEQRASRTDREIEALKQETAQTKALLAERDAAERERAVQGALIQVGGYLKATEAEYPYLLAEADSAEQVVWEILEEYERDGQILTLEQAARLANEHFKPAFERKAQRYKNLLAQEASGGSTKPEAPALKGLPPRKSLTNADASAAPTSKTAPPPKDDNERLDRAWAAMQAARSKT